MVANSCFQQLGCLVLAYGTASTDLNSAGSAVHTVSATCAFTCRVQSAVHCCYTAIMQHLVVFVIPDTFNVPAKSVLASRCCEQPGCISPFS